MHHGTVIMIEDCESNEHCSITVYHQELDAILSKSEEGYIVLNPEVVELIRRTKEEEKEESESSESSEEGECIDVDEEGDCVEVSEDGVEVSKDGAEVKKDDPTNDMDSKRQRVE